MTIEKATWLADALTSDYSQVLAQGCRIEWSKRNDALEFWRTDTGDILATFPLSKGVYK